MAEYTIFEKFTLPSKGKIYSASINPEVTLRSMTTAEEMKRLSRSDKMYENMSEIIDSCLIEKLPISSYDMCFGDYQFLLHKLRIVTYGNEYKINATCPYCLQTHEYDVDLDSLSIMEYTDDINKYMSLELPVTKKQITLKFQTPRIIDIISTRNKEMQRKTKTNIDYSPLYNVMYSINTIDGEVYDEIKLEQFVMELPMKDTNTITKYMEKLNTLLGIDTNVDLNCKGCGLVYTPSFRLTPEFFGPSIDI